MGNWQDSFSSYALVERSKHEANTHNTDSRLLIMLLKVKDGTRCAVSVHLCTFRHQVNGVSAMVSAMVSARFTRKEHTCDDSFTS